MTASATGDYLHLLGHSYRRKVLRTLIHHPSGSVHLSDTGQGNHPPSAEQTRHLRILDRAGLIEYEEEQTTVSQGPHFDRVVQLVRDISGEDTGSTVHEERDQLELIARGLCHDLKNGLNAVRSRARELDRDGQSDRRRDHVEVIERRTDTMLTRVQTIGSLMESITTDGEYELSACNLRETLKPEVARIRQIRRDVKITNQGIPDAAVRADGRLSLLFENLLRNAIEHNDTESPSIWVSGRVTGAQVAVDIEDDGPGFSADQFGMDLEESHSGGFGLEFVQRTVADYGGEFSVSDRDPRGTTVTIHLDRATAGVENG